MTQVIIFFLSIITLGIVGGAIAKILDNQCDHEREHQEPIEDKIYEDEKDTKPIHKIITYVSRCKKCGKVKSYKVNI